MTIQELVELHRSKVIGSVNLVNKFNHRKFKVCEVIATVRVLDLTSTEIKIPFSLNHHALVSDLWTMRLLDDHRIPFEFTDLTVRDLQVQAPCSPSEQAAAQSFSSPKVPKNCVVCQKTNMDDAKGCANPAVFSPAVGDWVCNLLTGRKEATIHASN